MTSGWLYRCFAFFSQNDYFMKSLHSPGHQCVSLNFRRVRWGVTLQTVFIYFLWRKAINLSTLLIILWGSSKIVEETPAVFDVKRDVFDLMELQAEIHQGVLLAICAGGVVDWDHFSGSKYSDLTETWGPKAFWKGSGVPELFRYLGWWHILIWQNHWRCWNCVESTMTKAIL